MLLIASKREKKSRGKKLSKIFFHCRNFSLYVNNMQLMWFHQLLFSWAECNRCSFGYLHVFHSFQLNLFVWVKDESTHMIIYGFSCAIMVWFKDVKLEHFIYFNTHISTNALIHPLVAPNNWRITFSTEPLHSTNSNRFVYSLLQI